MSEYRTTARSCPACGTAMTETPTVDAVLDTCPSCGGLWVDWLDGELRSVARRVAAERLPGALATDGSGQCPVCRVPLCADSAGADALAIGRCIECAGAFVPFGTLERLRQGEAVAAPGALETEAPALTRLLDAITRWLLPG